MAVELLEQHPDLTLSVNVSSLTTNDPEWLTTLQRASRGSRDLMRRLIVEITETATVSNFYQATRFIAAFKEKGCMFALDDFGSGMSSFSYLRNLPVDYLKIDGVFVRGIVDDPVSRTLVGNISDIGHLLGKITIAEYAEDEGTIEQLRELGVDYAQGHGISRPIPLDQMLTDHLLY